jgi:hypothetical protein
LNQKRIEKGIDTMRKSSELKFNPIRFIRADYNFILWSLIPYIAWSGEKLMGEDITFKEVVTIRPDGFNNICHACVIPNNMILSDDYVYMNNWSGPMWNSDSGHILWQIDSEWSDKRVDFVPYSEFAGRVFALYKRNLKERISRDEYTWLAEHEFVKTNGDYDGQFKVSWQIVILANKEIQTKLIAIVDRIKERYKCEFDSLNKEYTAAV